MWRAVDTSSAAQQQRVSSTCKLQLQFKGGFLPAVRQTSTLLYAAKLLQTSKHCSALDRFDRPSVCSQVVRLKFTETWQSGTWHTTARLLGVLRCWYQVLHHVHVHEAMVWASAMTQAFAHAARASCQQVR
jgi:hypothetical protein